MSGLEVIGSVASVLQLAATVYSISKTLYEVGDALSNAPSDIKDLARDLETFSEELHLLSSLLDGKTSRYSDRVYRLTAKIIGDCATICQKIDRVLKKLRSGSFWAKVKWVYKEKEIMKLLARLRDLKLSLMGTLSLLSALKADTMMDAMGVGSSSLLEGSRDENVARQTAKELEDARQKLEGITMYQGSTAPPSSFSTQSSWSSAASQATANLTTSSTMSPSTRSVSTSNLTPGPFISCMALPSQEFPRLNKIMMNPAAMDSVQSFQSAVSHLEPDNCQMEQQDPEVSSESNPVPPPTITLPPITSIISSPSAKRFYHESLVELAMERFDMTPDEAKAWAAAVPIPQVSKVRSTQEESRKPKTKDYFGESPTADTWAEPPIDLFKGPSLQMSYGFEPAEDNVPSISPQHWKWDNTRRHEGSHHPSSNILWSGSRDDPSLDQQVANNLEKPTRQHLPPLIYEFSPPNRPLNNYIQSQTIVGHGSSTLPQLPESQDTRQILQHQMQAAPLTLGQQPPNMSVVHAPRSQFGSKPMKQGSVEAFKSSGENYDHMSSRSQSLQNLSTKMTIPKETLDSSSGNSGLPSDTWIPMAIPTGNDGPSPYSPFQNQIDSFLPLIRRQQITDINVPTIDTSYAHSPSSIYGSPRDKNINHCGLGSSPEAGKGLSVLNAPLPTSFDSNGVSWNSRNGPIASSVPAKFGLESPPGSLGLPPVPKAGYLQADSGMSEPELVWKFGSSVNNHQPKAIRPKRRSKLSEAQRASAKAARRLGACITCVSRKIRCSGERPSCNTCVMWGLQCGGYQLVAVEDPFKQPSLSPMLYPDKNYPDIDEYPRSRHSTEEDNAVPTNPNREFEQPPILRPPTLNTVSQHRNHQSQHSLPEDQDGGAIAKYYNPGEREFGNPKYQIVSTPTSTSSHSQTNVDLHGSQPHPPRRPTLASHQSYSNQDCNFSREESKENGRRTCLDSGKEFNPKVSQAALTKASDALQSPMQGPYFNSVRSSSYSYSYSTNSSVPPVQPANKKLKRASSDDVVEMLNPNAQRYQVPQTPKETIQQSRGSPKLTSQQIDSLPLEQRKNNELYLRKQQGKSANVMRRPDGEPETDQPIPPQPSSVSSSSGSLQGVAEPYQPSQSTYYVTSISPTLMAQRYLPKQLTPNLLHSLLQERDETEPLISVTLSPDRISQLWWRALKQLRDSDPMASTRLEYSWQRIPDVVRDGLADHEIAGYALDFLNLMTNGQDIQHQQSRIDGSSNNSILSSIGRITDIMKVVRDTIHFKVGAFVWVCFCHAAENVHQRSYSTEDKERLFAVLADVATLIARYNVMESMYQQWHGMTLEARYEDALVLLCFQVLRFLDKVNYSSTYSISLKHFMDIINKADAACRGFSVTFLDPILDHNIKDVSDEDSDSDSDGTVFASRSTSTKRTLPEGFERSADHPDGLQAETPVKTYERETRQKV